MKYMITLLFLSLVACGKQEGPKEAASSGSSPGITQTKFLSSVWQRSGNNFKWDFTSKVGINITARQLYDSGAICAFDMQITSGADASGTFTMGNGRPEFQSGIPNEPCANFNLTGSQNYSIIGSVLTLQLTTYPFGIQTVTSQSFD